MKMKSIDEPEIRNFFDMSSAKAAISDDANVDMNKAKERLTQTFKFLKELNELRNPVTRNISSHKNLFWIDEWPKHPTIEVRRGDRTDDNGEAEESELEPIIRVRRAMLTPCPKPPSELDGWLKPGWQSVESTVEILESRNFPDKQRGSINVSFGSDTRRVKAFNEWAGDRSKWAIAELPAVQARKLFEQIHALWTEIQRQGDETELVLGDGILDVREHSIHYPVLVQRLNLRFDPSGPEFRFDTGTDKADLQRPLLRLVPNLEGRIVAQLDQQLDSVPVEPLGGESTTGFLKCLVQGVFANDGIFIEGKEADFGSAVPNIRRKPVIFSRPRNAGLSATLEHIIEDLEQGKSAPPEGLTRIVGVEIDDDANNGNGGRDTEPAPVLSTVEPDLLFSKPSNAEQYEIAARLAKSKAVLVQGPPGTGKTHTIANLLGCLLAQGKTVLVTAHTTKALRVLREKVDDSLKALCLSVLESDADGYEQLKISAQEIASRLSISDSSNLRSKAASLRQRRTKLREEEESLRVQLRDARFSEVEEVVVGGEALSPIDVAKRVKSGKEKDGWIPSPLSRGILCPLTASEVRSLYATNASITAGDEAQLSIPQPKLEQLLAPADFRLRTTEKVSANTRAKEHHPEFWDENAEQKTTSGQLRGLHRRINAVSVTLSEKEIWLREVLYAGWVGVGLRDAWDDLLLAIDAVFVEAGAAQRLIVAHGSFLPKAYAVGEIAAVLGQIIEYLEGGGSLSLMTKLTNRTWHKLLKSCNVNIRAPKALEKIRALRAKAQLDENRKHLANRWKGTVEINDGPIFSNFGSAPERTAHGYVNEIQSRLEWRKKVWEPLISDLRAAGFHWDQWLASHPPVAGAHGELTRLQSAVSHGLAELLDAAAALHEEAELRVSLSQQRTYLAGFPQSELAAALLKAQDGWDAEAYENLCRNLARIEGLSEEYQTRLSLLAQLRSSAPTWADAIALRQAPHGSIQPPGDTIAAWRWRQWYDELDRRAKVSINELQERLSKTQDELRKSAASIIELETWAAQRERTLLRSQQSLMGYVQTIRKIGKGTGKRVPELLRQARELLTVARSAVPVWIMPLSRVYESFDPRHTRFDVVIIDEASQSDVTALAALYLGMEHVVVGDKEQVTPDAVGQRLDEVQRLIDINLQGIPNSHLYDGLTSIYDLAETAFGGVVALREHFRCVPEIIQFSNELSYNLTIRSLREPNSSPVRPALISHRVQGFRHDKSKINNKEAEEIAALVMACLEDPAYEKNEFGEPTTFGIISLLGLEQALLIEEILRRNLPPNVFEKHRLLCGNAAQFQGDERDVVFLSMVDGPPDDGQLPNRDEGPKGIYKKRYNVAVSRARNQLWVIHSIDPNAHLKPRDLRRRLIEHARDPQALMQLTDMHGKRTDSIFEKLVLQRLLANGYRVQTQWPVGAYRIDLVVEGKSDRLAIECDGEKWHSHDQLQRDLDREAILCRLGWKFARIRGSVFFRDPDAAMAPIFSKLDQLGIEPLERDAAPIQTEESVQRIKRNAESLRAKWEEERKEAVLVESHNQQVITDSQSQASKAILAAQSPQDPNPKGLPGESSQKNASIRKTGDVPVRKPGNLNQGAKPNANSPVNANGGGGVLQELSNLYPGIHEQPCTKCGQIEKLAITTEGIVIMCNVCRLARRIDIGILQNLADKLNAKCFRCSGKLMSVTRSFGNIMVCKDPSCKTNNSWQGLSERLNLRTS